MKKFLSLLLSLCLAMGLATEVFAAGSSGTTDVVFESDVAAPDVFNVVVPAEIPIYMSKAGDLQISNTLVIENKSSKAVEVKAIQVDGKNGWSVLAFNSDFSDKPADTKDLALSFRGDATDGTGSVKPAAGNWVIGKDNSLPINTAAKVPLQTQASRTSIATVVWTVDWAEPGAQQPVDPEKPSDIKIQVLPGDHGSADVTEIHPGSDGRVAEYPEVKSDTGYDFKNWVDAENLSLVDDSTVYEKDSSIRPVFELKSGWTSVPVNPVPGVTVKPEKDPEVLIDPDGVVQVVPDIKPDEGYTGGNLTDQDGNEVRPGTVINNTINITIIINVTVDGGDKPENPDAGKYPIEIPVNDGEHGKADADKITTDDEGRIPGFPGVTPDEGWLHDGWEDQDGNPVDETTKLNPGDEIRPTFKPDPDYKPDRTVTVPVLPGDHGNAAVDSVVTGSDGKINPYPDVTPEPGWLPDGYVNQNGEPVDENTVFEDGDSIKPVFKADPDYVPDLTVTVEVLPGEHGRSPSTSVTTDSEGKIRAYPGVDPDDGYVFDHWTDRNGNPVDENTVFKRGDAIVPVFVAAPVEDVTVSFAASKYNGTISGNTSPVTVPAGTKWSEITKPVTNVGAQAAFMGWYAGSTALTDDFEITEDMTATAEFKSWYWTDGTTVEGLTDAYTKSGSPSELRIPAVIDGVKMTSISGIRSVLGYSRDSAVTSVYVEDGYTEFAGMAFCNEWDIRSFRFPSTLQTIAYSALFKVGENTNGALGSLTLPSGVKSIGDSAFNMSGWTSITIPDGCTVSRSNVFNGMAKLTYLKIGSGSSDFSFTFQNLPVLRTLVLPSTTRTLGSNAFVGLPNLRTVQIYASKSLVSGSNDPNGNWSLNGSLDAPNATITWMNG